MVELQTAVQNRLQGLSLTENDTVSAQCTSGMTMFAAFKVFKSECTHLRLLLTFKHWWDISLFSTLQLALQLERSASRED